MPANRIIIPESELSEKFIHAAGPGGQNVNKVATAVQLRFDVNGSPSLSAYVKNRLKAIAKHLMSDDGILMIEASRHRMQGRNREDARARLHDLIAEAAKPPPPKRKKTRPTKGSVERRLKAKSGRGNIKKMRGRVRGEE
jgi:ribosome-associated protein